MKKSLLKMSALLLSAGTMAGLLVACNNPGTSSSGAGSSTSTGGGITLEVPEDKTAYVMKLSDSSIALESFNSVFLTGDMLSPEGKDEWATGLNAIEMKSGILDGYLVGYSDKYVAGEHGTQTYNYQLVVGYNSTAEIADSKKGLVWNDAYKSEECKSFGGESGLGNPTFEEGFDAEKRIADLGTHTFSSQPSAPSAPLKDFKVQVSFAESVPEYAVPHFLGSYNGWNTNYTADLEAATRMTVVEGTERKTWELNLGDTYADTYEWTMSIDYTLEAKPNQEGFSWNKPDQLGTNGKYTVAPIMGDGYAMNITDGDPLTFDFAAKLPDPTQTANLKIVATTTGEAVKAEAKLYVCGNFTGWKPQEMTASDDRKTFTLEFMGLTAGELDFGINDGTDNWAHKVAGDNANIKSQLTAGQDTILTVTADLAAAFNGDPIAVVYTNLESTAWTK